MKKLIAIIFVLITGGLAVILSSTIHSASASLTMN